jgi:hypothetical protein
LVKALIELSVPIRALATKKGDHEPTDKPERRLRIVEKPATGKQRCGMTRPLHHQSGTGGREPRPREHQPHHKEHESHKQLKQLSTVAARLAVRVEVREHRDASEERDDPNDALMDLDSVIR